MWWAKFVKDYLTFSKKERNGIAVILLLCAALLLLSRYLPVKKTSIDKTAFQKELAGLKITIDTSHQAYDYPHDDARYFRPKNYENGAASPAELFTFDPNTLDATGWKRLGVRAKTINTIHNFIAKGYRFRKPDDLKKIYGLRPDQADRLVPYVRINETEFASAGSSENTKARFAKKPDAETRNRAIDINSADTAEFISLPGIGSKLAARIVNFRQKLGGFYSVDQIAETYGVPDSTFQKIKPRLLCSAAAVRKININSADANELKAHSYIKWNIANAIVNYRNQHGNYKSVDDLRKIEIVSEELFAKIAPYLTVTP